MYKILIVEDEIPISNLIALSLKSAGYSCEIATDGMKASDLLLNKHYDLVLLDIMLPEIDGYELMEFIRPMEIPVIYISAKAKVEDRVKGLKLGADDYLTKPFEIVELLARVETVLRRYHKIQEKLQVDNIEIDVKAHVVRRENELIPLTDKEYSLLIFFIENRQIALFREKIYEHVWGGEYTGDSRTVDLHVQRLRKKLGWEKKIVSVHKIGYRLEV